MFILLPFVAVLFGADPAVIARLVLAEVFWLGGGYIVGMLIWEFAELWNERRRE